MRRNPGFSLRAPETVSSASARVSEEDIRGWFQHIKEWLAKNDMLHILDCPDRVFNGDILLSTPKDERGDCKNRIQERLRG